MALSTRLVTLLGIPLLAALAALPQPADACSPPPQGCMRSIPWLGDGMAVYTNERIQVLLECVGTLEPDAPWPTLVDESGQELPSTWERTGEGLWTRTGPELPPNTQITLVDHWTSFCSAVEGGIEQWDTDGIPEPACNDLQAGEVRTWIQFQTQSGPDLEPPPAPAAPRFECGEFHPVEGEIAPCGGELQEAWWAEVWVDWPEDDTLRRVDFFFRREGEDYDFSKPGRGGPGRFEPQSQRPGIWYAVAQAVDRAGNRSELSKEVRFVFPDDCTFEVPYPDSDVVDPPLDGDAQAGGCAAAGSGRSGFALAWVVLVLGLGVRRRA